MKGRVRGRRKVALFGHFDGTNFGNESCLQAVLHHLHRLQADAQAICICSGPQPTAATYGIRALAFSGSFGHPSPAKGFMSRMARKGWALLSRPLKLLRCIKTMHEADVLLIPGTGLLTDAYGLWGWGPYGLLKWALIAKACGCKLALISVGAGPIQSVLGSWCYSLVLSLADYRSYRDTSSVRYLERIGLATGNEPITPDLAFSLPKQMIPSGHRAGFARPTVGLGTMDLTGAYNGEVLADSDLPDYLDALVEFSQWILQRGFNVRLLSGDVTDAKARYAFRRRFEERVPSYDHDRIIDEPVHSVTDVLSQIASTEFVVATRFHNIVFGFLCVKPVIAIAFHHKCEALMATMGMSDYCLEMSGLKGSQLIEKARCLEARASSIKSSIEQTTAGFRKVLDRQYDTLFRDRGSLIQLDR